MVNVVILKNKKKFLLQNYIYKNVIFEDFLKFKWFLFGSYFFFFNMAILHLENLLKLRTTF